MRNEISPRQGPIRLREFTIMEVELFFDPENPACPRIGEVKDELLQLIPASLRTTDKEETQNLTVSEALEKSLIKTEWQAYFMALSKRLLRELGVPADRQRFIEKLPWERAHYSTQGYDQEVLLEQWGWVEVSGHNYRGDYDLSRHISSSKMDLRVFKATPPITKEVINLKPRADKLRETFGDKTSTVISLLGKADAQLVDRALREKGRYDLQSYEILTSHVEIIRRKETESGTRFVPHVVEPSFGADRMVYAVLEYAFGEKEDRTVLKLPKDVAPIQVMIFPLMNKDGLKEKALGIYQTLLRKGLRVEYDESGSIGRRYARTDEIGVPLAITVDYQTLEDDTVTIRDRDTWEQVRKEILQLPQYLRGCLCG
jgi:glycyl-tRNA synthetase